MHCLQMTVLKQLLDHLMLKEMDLFLVKGRLLILEDYDHAIARGAKIYAEVIGGGMSSDAHHMTAPLPEGVGVVAVMKNCLNNAGICKRVDYINTHGTSTPLGCCRVKGY